MAQQTTAAATAQRVGFIVIVRIYLAWALPSAPMFLSFSLHQF
jgi:hypothetical protein